MNRARTWSGSVFVGGLALVGLLGWLGCTNDPFDPTGLANARPVVRFFVAPADSDGELHFTSYNNRHFSWSGSDRDGTVEAFYVSVRTRADEPRPWVETTETDTFMTFSPDDQGLAEATFYLVCRDNLGALSDTVVQYVPMRNSPPVINFQADFEPLKNLQRDVTSAPPDTIYWNWGTMNFRGFAYDQDGSDTMDNYFRYTVADVLPECIRQQGEVGADPTQCWVQAPFATNGDIRNFEIFLRGLATGTRTLTVSVGDEAGSRSLFTYRWEVRDPRGPLLLVPDNYGSLLGNLYRPFLDGFFGATGYDTYEFPYGYPDDPAILLDAVRHYSVVLWLSGGSTSTILNRAAATNGVLEQYVNPADGGDGGRLWVVSRVLTGGNSGLPNHFRTNVLGIGVSASPVSELVPAASAVGAEALSGVAWLPSVTLESRSARGFGLVLNAGSEVLYQFELCDRCFGSRQPYDPIIAFRRPSRAESEYAKVVGFSFDWEYMQRAAAVEALAGLLVHELGVPQP
jgi:hypothetical protein